MAPKLHEAIYRLNFEEVIGMLRSEEGLSLAQEVDSDNGRLALHAAAQFQCRSTSDQQTIEPIFRCVFRLFPEGATLKDKYGNFPIHYACRNRTKDNIEKLINAFPNSVEERDQHGNLPIHLVLDEYSKRIGIAQNLIKRFPKGLTIKNDAGKLPIHLALANLNVTLPFIEFFLQKFPSSVSIAEETTGKLPLHVACERTEFTIVMHLVNAFPKGLKQEDKEGNLPIHYATKCNILDLRLLKVLISKYPEGLMHKNKKGELPIHCYRRGDDDIIFQCLVKSCPQSLLDPSHLPLQPVIEYIAARLNTSYGPKKFPEVCRPVPEISEVCRTVLPEIFGSVFPKSMQHAAYKLLGEVKDKSDSTKDGNKATTDDENEQSKSSMKQEMQKLQADMNRTKKAMQTQRSSFEEKIKHLKQEKNHLKAAIESEQSKHGNEGIRAEMDELKTTLDMYKKIAREGRKFDKAIIAKLRETKIEAHNMDELKAFATSIKSRIDLLKAKMTPNAKPSLLQIMFSSFIKDPNVSRADLVDCIESLDAELTGLESDIDCADDSSSTDETCNTLEIPSDDLTDSRRTTKRPRVSLP